ncbi:MAG: hypothetical protein ABR509_01325 [Candidatus Limnocylindria bacterium]
MLIPLVVVAAVLTACPSAPASATPTARAETPEATEPAAETVAPEASESAAPAKTPDESAAATEAAASAEEGGNYTTITDDEGALSVSVPDSWTDTRSGGWTLNDEPVGLSLTASTDIDDWYATYDVDGVLFAASRSITDEYDPETLLDEYDLSGDCTYDGREDYSDPSYTGFEDFYLDCGGTETEFAIITAEPEDGSFIMLVQIQAATDDGFAAYNEIINTFVVTDADALP